MKKLITILFLFSVAYGQTTRSVGFLVQKSDNVDWAWNDHPSEGFKSLVNWFQSGTTPILYDTVKVKILIDEQNQMVPYFIYGWLVKEYISTGSYDYLPITTDKVIFLYKDKKTRIDNNVIWNYKLRNW